MAETYDLIVIGAGSAGLTAAGFAAKLGVNVALVEKGRVGGDCTWTGCVPSKALLRAAQVAHTARTAAQYGVITAPPQVDMVRVRDYVRGAIADIYQHETPEQLRASGVAVLPGAARFVNDRTIQIDGRMVTAKKFVIATGAGPIIPAIPGLDDTPYQTYEQFFDNVRLPDRLLVIGAGATGVELAQAYGRFGAQVTLIDEALLPRQDRDAAVVLEPLLAQEGVRFVTGLASSVRRQGAEIAVTVDGAGLVGDQLLVAAGRRPNIHSLDLAKAGIDYDERGVVVDDALRTTVRHIYAAGDCVQGSHQFTHFAGWQGFQAVRNALLPGSESGFNQPVPRVIYTAPEIAQVGLTEAEARQRFGAAVQVMCEDLDRVDRAVTDGVPAGFIKMVYKKNGRLLGATIVSPRAGEIITEFTLALSQRLKIRDLAAALHAYPSYAMGVQLPAAAAATDQFLDGPVGKLMQRLANR